MPDLKAQVEELLALHGQIVDSKPWARNAPASRRISAIMNAFPAIARAYLALLKESAGHRQILTEIASAIDPSGDEPVCADIVPCIIAGRNAMEENERLKSENAALREVAKMARRFAAYAHVLEVLADEDKQLGPDGKHNGWDDLNPVLGARGQVLTMGDFRLLRDALSRADALVGEKP